MFNFIVVGNNTDDFFHRENGQSSFPVSRLFESTDEDIRSKLLPLTNATLEYMATLPVIFMTEPEQNNVDGADYAEVRIGYILRLKLEKIKNDHVIKFDFEIKRDLSRCKLAEEKEYSSHLQLGGFGLRRTHWSIKKLELSYALRVMGIENDSNQQLSDPITPPDTHDELEIISDVSTYLNKVLDLDYKDGAEVFYRGHSDYRYELTPSLYRKNMQGNFRYRQHESEMITELLTVQPTEFMNDRYMLDKLVRMQHYGLPTRLLDVTTNPLIALYFACSSIKSEKEKEVAGNVIIMTAKKNQVKFFDSDTVSCMANLARLPERLKKTLNFRLENEAFNKTEPCAQLLHLIKDEKSYFKDVIEPADLQRILVVKGRMTNPRINSQSGAFLIFGIDAVLPETGLSELKIKKIRVENKKSILEQLARFGINESTIYPGIEKAALEITKKYDMCSNSSG